MRMLISTRSSDNVIFFNHESLKNWNTLFSNRNTTKHRMNRIHSNHIKTNRTRSNHIQDIDSLSPSVTAIYWSDLWWIISRATAVSIRTKTQVWKLDTQLWEEVIDWIFARNCSNYRCFDLLPLKIFSCCINISGANVQDWSSPY